MLRLLVLANNDVGLYKLRKELLLELVKEFEVFLSLPYGEFIPGLEKSGCKFVETPVERRGTNPITDFKLLCKYISIIKTIRPAIVLTYTIKPNIYGGIACRILNIPYISNVTGLGTSIENAGLLQKVSLSLYKVGLKKASCVFFQNEPNQKLFCNKKIVSGKTRLIPGSGVNLEEHCFEEYPSDKNGVRILFIGRIMKDKGIRELIEAVPQIKARYPNIEFCFIGTMEENYWKEINELEKQGIISFYGQQKEVHSFIKNSHATILPSYHEGTSNVLLESASTGRPILASRVTGCIEAFDEGISGFGFEAGNVNSLVETVIKFINLPYDHKKNMGLAGRKKMEREFDRNFIIRAYMEEIDAAINNQG